MKKANFCAAVLASVIGMACQAAEAPASSPSASFPVPGQSGPTTSKKTIRIVIHRITAKQSNGNAEMFLPGTAVFILETNANGSLVNRGNIIMERGKFSPAPAVWIPDENLAGLSAFKPLQEWSGQTKYDASGIDDINTYYFNRNGSFKQELQKGEQPKHTVSGQLYQAGDVIWARATGRNSLADAPDYLGRHTDEMFWLRPDGTLCKTDNGHNCF